jgi:hypothetical protein
VQILMGQIDDIYPEVELRKSNGDLVASNFGGSFAGITAVLPGDDTYIIICKDHATFTGQYAISMLRMVGYPLSENEPDVGPIASGAPLPGRISLPGDLDAATFRALSGDTVQVRMSQVDDIYPELELRDPDGALVASHFGGSFAEITRSLNMDGTYTIICKDHAVVLTGEYSVSFVRILGVNRTLTLTSAGTGTGKVEVNGTLRSLPYTGSFAPDTVVTLRAVPDRYCRFERWSGDLVGATNPATIVMDLHADIDVHFLFRASACVDANNRTGTEDGSPQHPFNTIQEGVGVVGLEGTVKIARGSHTGHITFAGGPATVKGGYLGGTYPGTGDFSEANRDPATNPSVINGGGAATQVTCQDAAARGSSLDGLTFRNGGAIFRGGLVLTRVVATD